MPTTQYSRRWSALAVVVVPLGLTACWSPDNFFVDEYGDVVEIEQTPKSALRTEVRGSVETIMEDYFDEGFAHHNHVLHADDGRSYPLRFAGTDGHAQATPSFEAGGRVAVYGARSADGAIELGAGDFDVVLEPRSDPEQALVESAAPLINERPKKVAVILLVQAGNNGARASLDQVRQLVFSGDNAVSTFMKEASFGQRTFTGIRNPEGDVFGYFEIPASAPGCHAADWGEAARRAASNAGVNVAAYDYIIHMWPRTSRCGWAGLAPFFGKITYVNGFYGGVTAHEIGHNFGLHHASSYRCKNSAGTAVAIGNNCVKEREYGDLFDVMGSGGLRHYSSYNKGRLNWLRPEATHTVASSGTYEIAPQETLGGSGEIQALRVVRTRNASGTPTQYYYLEYRRPIGFDSSFSSTGAAVNGVTLRLGPGYSARALDARSFLIDTTPSTSSFTDAPLAVGQVFHDPQKRIRIETVSATPEKVQVRVDLNSDGGAGGAGDGDGGGDGGGGGEPGMEEEPNNALAEANRLALGSSLKGEIFELSDYYKINHAPGSLLRLTLTDLTADCDLVLYNASGTRLAVSEKPQRNNEEIARTLNGGTYYARVYGWQGARCTYRIGASGH